MYTPHPSRYMQMDYRRCGRSGLKLPAVSLGLWHNFSNSEPFSNMEAMCRKAFDLGITHFDLANNYGHGSAEENFGRILSRGLGAYRDEIVISTKAGYAMWEGPYGDMGSRKYLIASLDQSLKRMGIDYVDIFYHHRPDPDTPAEETALALDRIVNGGKALYVGLSNYESEHMAAILPILRELKTPFIVNQPSYSLLNRFIEKDGLDKLAKDEGFGLAIFSPLNRGLLTSRYLEKVSDGTMIIRLNKLNAIAAERGQTLSQMALSWILQNEAVTTVIIGASRQEQIAENVEAIHKPEFSENERDAINALTL